MRMVVGGCSEVKGNLQSVRLVGEVGNETGYLDCYQLVRNNDKL